MDAKVGSSTTGLTQHQARRAFDRFKALFPIESYGRWHVAGALRRGDLSVSGCTHVVMPILDTAPMLCDERRAVGTNTPANPVWLRIEQLVAAGHAQIIYHGPGEGFLWSDHLRAVSYQGVPHYVFAAAARNWGVALAAATGPYEFVRGIWARLAARGMQVRPGLTLASRKRMVPVPNEEALFALAGAVLVHPAQRGIGAILEASPPAIASRRNERRRAQ